MFSVSRYIRDYADVLDGLDDAAVESMAHRLRDAWRTGRTVFCCGNGGSAASASHVMMDLTKLASPVAGPRIRALALNENVAAISAISNDIAYGEIFVEQLRPFLAPNDVVIGFSTSGSSLNVIRAIEYANTQGAVTLGITGLQGHELRSRARHTLVVNSTNVQQIEDATMVVGHLLCLRVKDLIAREMAVPIDEAVPARASRTVSPATM